MNRNKDQKCLHATCRREQKSNGHHSLLKKTGEKHRLAGRPETPETGTEFLAGTRERTQEQSGKASMHRPNERRTQLLNALFLQDQLVVSRHKKPVGFTGMHDLNFPASGKKFRRIDR